MKSPGRKRSARPAPRHELATLRLRLAEAESTLLAIRTGGVDALVVAGEAGPRVFTLEGADHAYRVLIESMQEGALTLTADALILYANPCFARMVGCRMEQVMGSYFHRFLAAEDWATLRPLLERPDKPGAKVQVLLAPGGRSQTPAQISIRPLARNGANRATIGLVVTDMTEARQKEEMLRALTHSVVQAQEAERGRVALELHDHITQLLCAILVRSQTLADELPARDGPARREAIKLRELLGEAAAEVERISRNLRPGVLDQLGLVAALRDTSTRFAERTGVPVKLALVALKARLPGQIELTLLRILQEALMNVEKHAVARHVTVHLRMHGEIVRLRIKDDGIGFDGEPLLAGRSSPRGLGLAGMHERAAYVGGTLKIKSLRHVGTEVEVLIPLTSL